MLTDALEQAKQEAERVRPTLDQGNVQTIAPKMLEKFVEIAPAAAN